VGLVLHVASELAPIAKVGGLGDVVYGLSQECRRIGHDVLIVLPKYAIPGIENLTFLKCVAKKTIHIPGESPFETLFWECLYEGLSLLLIDPQSPRNLFQRSSIYGEPNDLERFLLFCFLTLEYLCLNPPRSCVLHLHDWPTAFVACLYKQLYQTKLPSYTTILTLHNILHQGKGAPHHAERFGIQKTPALEDPAQPHLINILKSGIVHADHIVAVSPTYAHEITTHELGYHLNTTLASHKEKLSGILNGIDLSYWNPQTDPSLLACYSPTDVPTKVLEAKEKNKHHLHRLLDMPSSSAPLIGCITRLDTQKGPHLIAHAITTTLEQEGQYILLGQAADPLVREEFTKIKHRYSTNPHFHFHDQFDESLARLIYAAADFIVIPSLFEPCGLTQMIAMRYCTIPIVRITGGLADTVSDINNKEVPFENKVGICFHDMNIEQLDHALTRAFHLYQDKPLLCKILKNISKRDFSWKESAKKYLQLYRF
jgi:starch synthase